MKKYLFSKKEWNKDIRIIEWLKLFIIFAWVMYFLLKIKGITTIKFALADMILDVLDVANFLKLNDLVNSLWEKRLTILIAVTVLVMVYDGTIKYLPFIKYHKLPAKNFSLYDLPEFPYQKNLVNFLNYNNESHGNVFWLDGPWGSEKSYFLKTFFKNQCVKKDEIYYVSCFGLSSREQVEKVLISEIESHSILGILDYLPGIGKLLKWVYRSLGDDMMKRNSIVIFDDLERVSVTNDPQDFNDILGYIDYISEHKNHKVVVVLNSERLMNTKKKIIDPKFKLNWNQYISPEEAVSSIVDSSAVTDLNFKNFLKYYYQFHLAGDSTYNLREVTKGVQEAENIQNNQFDNFILKYLNESKKCVEFLRIQDLSRQARDALDRDDYSFYYVENPYYFIKYLKNCLIEDFYEYVEFPSNEEEERERKVISCFESMLDELWIIGGSETSKLRALSWIYDPVNTREFGSYNPFFDLNVNKYVKDIKDIKDLLVEIFYDKKQGMLKESYELTNLKNISRCENVIKEWDLNDIKVNGKKLIEYIQ